HERMSREDILARMVPVKDRHSEPREESPAKPPRTPSIPPTQLPAPDNSQYCSFAQPAPLPVAVFVWHPPVAPAHVPAALPDVLPPTILLTGIAGRAPPQFS